MANTVDKVINIALAEVGYLEKSASAYRADKTVLDDKTRGAGYDNYTKYGRDMHAIYPEVMDFPAPYCDAFVDWCFYRAYGVANAKALLGGNFDDYTVASAQLYKNKGAYFKSGPKVGDQIFFNNGTRICHTGIVYKVDSKYVYTIEGNSSGGSTLISNGGGVAKKSYALNYYRIDGYGRPKYDVEATVTSSYSLRDFVRDVQSATGATVDGVAGSETLFKTVTVSASKNNRHAVVKAVQRRLNALGYDCGSVDGIAGPKFTSAVKRYQGANGCVADGEITARAKTWKKLLGLM